MCNIGNLLEISLSCNKHSSLFQSLNRHKNISVCVWFFSHMNLRNINSFWKSISKNLGEFNEKLWDLVGLIRLNKKFLLKAEKSQFSFGLAMYILIKLISPCHDLKTQVKIEKCPSITRSCPHTSRQFTAIR